MAKHRRFSRLPGAALSLLVPVMGLGLSQRWHTYCGDLSAQAAAGPSSYVASEIDAIGRDLVGGASSIRADTELNEVSRADGRVQRRWDACFIDAEGRNRAHVIADAETGEVLYVSLSGRHDRRPTPLDRGEAVVAAQQALERTRVASQSPWWVLLSGPLRTPDGGWQVCWRGADRCAVVALDRWSGTLRCALTSRLAPEAAAWLPLAARAALRPSATPCGPAPLARTATISRAGR